LSDRAPHRAATLGILLAGGSGRRFGGPKALAAFRGRTLLARALDELAASCDDVVVVAPAALALPVAPALLVEDDGAGPLSALVTGLEARPCDRALALAVDLPLVDRSHLARLLEEARRDGRAGEVGEALAWIPQVAGHPQPLAAVYAAGAAAKLRAALARGERALVPAALALPARVLDEAHLKALGIPPEALEDADTPADLARIEAGARRAAITDEEGRA